MGKLGPLQLLTHVFTVSVLVVFGILILQTIQQVLQLLDITDLYMLINPLPSLHELQALFQSTLKDRRDVDFLVAEQFVGEPQRLLVPTLEGKQARLLDRQTCVDLEVEDHSVIEVASAIFRAPMRVGLFLHFMNVAALCGP